MACDGGATCLLRVGDDGPRRKLKLPERNLRGLKIAITACSLLDGEVNTGVDRFQLLDRDFNEFVDLMDDNDEVPDKAVVRVVKQLTGTRITTEASASSMPMTSSALGPMDSCQEENLSLIVTVRYGVEAEKEIEILKGLGETRTRELDRSSATSNCAYSTFLPVTSYPVQSQTAPASTT